MDPAKVKTHIENAYFSLSFLRYPSYDAPDSSKMVFTNYITVLRLVTVSKGLAKLVSHIWGKSPELVGSSKKEIPISIFFSSCMIFTESKFVRLFL